MSYDWLVIGGGASGLTAAVLLAQEGRRVALVEKSPRLAPLLRGFRRGNFHFDTGFHYSGGLGQGEILDLFFRHLGVSERLRTTPFDLTGFDRVREPGQAEFAFPVGEERLEERLCREFPGQEKAVSGYLAEVRRACAVHPYLDLDAPLAGSGALFGLDGTSLRKMLSRWTDLPRLRRLLAVHTLLYGVPPEEAPFRLHASVVGPYYQSVHGLVGGGLALAEAFTARLAELGVDIFLGRGVRELLFTPAGTLRGARLEDETVVETRGCVATLHPTLLPALLPEGVFRPIYRRRLLALEDSLPAFTLYGVCRKPNDLLRGRNIFLLGPLKKGLEDSIYLTAADNGPGSGSGLIAIAPVPSGAVERWKDSVAGRRPAGYEAYKAEQAAQLVRRIEEGCPELGGIEVMATATALTMRDYLHTPKGGLYGVRHRLGQYNPQPRTRVANLLLAGQGVAAPGVLGAVLSGFLTCGEVIGHERLRERVKACR
ncbi:phytoene desaturase family protein [Desulfuromonas acetexigens]|uniref:phytoene desaturase family protein n=1 Tax=Trichloromonas acetexigens TaxID=38815 RepID=UPI0014795601|nr:NAD(P)/FAD-dependent oxidoreductase [Desulfuromonas acetexigens]